MSDHRFILDKGSKKHHCPQCGKKRFVRYIDTITGEYLPDHYGRCDREANCGYFADPYKDGYVKGLLEVEKGNEVEFPKYAEIKRVIPKAADPVFFDFKTFKKTLGNYEKNVFIQNLLQRVAFPIPADEITKIIQLYRLGTIANGYRAGAVTFPFIDRSGNVRAVQVKQFDKENHTTATDFLHSIIEKHHTEKGKPLPEWLKAYTQQEKRITCLFGEHLLEKYTTNPVALVEAPKTAIYGTLYFGTPKEPKDLIWLAVYNKSSFSFEKLKALTGRNIIVFPDLSKDGCTYTEWQTKAKEYETRLPGTKFIFSDLLEKLAPANDRQDGADLADFLIKLDWRKFRKQKKYEDYSREERLLFGLNRFKNEDLRQLGSRMFADKNKMEYREICQYLQTEGLTGNDIPDLMDILCIRKIMKATDYPDYILN